MCARFARVFPGIDRTEPRALGVARRRTLPGLSSLPIDVARVTGEGKQPKDESSVSYMY